jgi:hydrogenase expression/formation protein HypD
MKHLTEYRNLEATKSYLNLIEKTVTKPWKIMEICGGADPWFS